MFHPHTNMTKAALNMMTLTSAREFEKDQIYMSAVDVGWISTGAKESLEKNSLSRDIFRLWILWMEQREFCILLQKE
jgi:NAD(P)-dependent dehydrogenase (short-subunit alcohol dehydrogenase family)